MLPLLYACGLFSFGFALFHLSFWRLFRWKEELQNLSPPNRAIMQILNLRLIYIFLFVGVLCFLFPAELAYSPLGKTVLIGASLFWLGRLIEQFVFLRINHPFVHVLSALFLAGAIGFLLPVVLG